MFSDMSCKDVQDIAHNNHKKPMDSKSRKRHGSKLGGLKTSTTKRSFLGDLHKKDFALVVMKEDK